MDSMNFGVSTEYDEFSSDCSFKSVETNQQFSLEKPTVINILKTVPSGIGLDIAKNHTGIVIWNGVSVETYGFYLTEYDKLDYFGEYKMRREFKKKLTEIVKGKHFEYCIVEDVFGGDNFDTVRKLLALNTVMDELIFENVCTVGTFVRWNETKWAAATRTIYKQKGKLKSKIETQGLLEYLEFDFYLKYKDYPETDAQSKKTGLPTKKELFFEDICDACGMLLGLVIAHNYELNITKSSLVRLSDIKMLYVDYIEDTYMINDKRVQEEGFIILDDFDCKHIEDSIKQAVATHPHDVLCVELPPNKLGRFGIKHNFTFFTEGEGYLIFYNKKG